ncbi:OsmC family protein [Candidatus Nitrosocosmicus sp. FF01]|uniref:OsmC family protein n=1 Tax=Candidatus Nitrosocosmicus sp. FF01 TaxID=3397670 RepID=UPI0039EBB4BE
MTQTSQSNKIENEKVINGVNVTNLFEAINAITDNPNISKFNFRAKGQWINGGHNQTTINEFDGACQTHTRNQPFVFDKDEPPVLLGKDLGANPVEYALSALNGCLTTTLIYHAAAQGIKIEKVESTLSGDLDIQGLLGMSEKVRNGYEKIKVTFRVKADASEEKIKELVDLAQKRSPVFDIISRPTPVEVSLQS